MPLRGPSYGSAPLFEVVGGLIHPAKSILQNFTTDGSAHLFEATHEVVGGFNQL
jgi:hypothetical protein